MSDIDPGPLMSVTKAADYLGVSKIHVRRLLASHAFTRIDVGGRVLVPQAEVHDAARNGIQPPPPVQHVTDAQMRRLELEIRQFRERIASKYGSFGMTRVANRMDPRHYPDPEDAA